MLTYQETLDYLYGCVPMFQNLGAGAYKPGLGTTLAISEYFGNPHKALKKCIHIAGTNGKGSTAHTLAAILQSAGYKTGLYTSPHLLDFRERSRVNGVPVDEDFVCRFTDKFIQSEELRSLAPTFFELTTIMAFRYFADMDVDVAVIETGLGGRLDCTNIITPCLSVITNISLDHTALLGHTEEAIAGEKAGIIKPSVPVVIGRAEGAVLNVFRKAASDNNSPLLLASDADVCTDIEVEADALIYKGTEWGDVRGELHGECQKENGKTILTALSLLKEQFLKIDSEAVKRGFSNVCSLTGLAGRWMQISETPVKIICDTGHNPGGWEYLGKSLNKIGNLHLVLGFVNDKDLSTITDYMPNGAKYYFATPSVKRGRPAEETQAEAAKHGIEGKAYASVAEAFKAAQSSAKEGDTIFVGGSTFVVADFLSLLQEEGRE
ncbi:MAG: bifunctional folylpolyglutamate synthase/dihydrofolate synthase [Bacteroidales bacterium]|nr:bifunctional folylpolyglutamate synthase/dihydrofolate synthase [Bacteroidales bacterium]